MKVDWGMDSKDHMFSQASLRMWAILLGEEVGGSSVEGRSCVRRDLVDAPPSSFLKELNRPSPRHWELTQG